MYRTGKIILPTTITLLCRFKYNGSGELSNHLTMKRARLLQFATGTSKVPLNGFKELSGASGTCKFSIHRDYGSTDRLPSSHTCFNQIDLPAYDCYETLRDLC